MNPRILQIVVPGHPRPQPRHRAVKGKIIAVIDRRVEAWQESVRRATLSAISDFGREEIAETAFWSKRGALLMKVIFKMPHKQPSMWGQLHISGNKADLDNLEKLVMDEIAGKVKSPLPGNDSRICHKEGLKVWCRPREAGCVVTLQEITAAAALARFMQPMPETA